LGSTRRRTAEEEEMRDLNELGLIAVNGTSLLAPTESQLVLVEHLIGVDLPVSYIEFLKFSNGGYPEVNTFEQEIDEGIYPWTVNLFLSIASNSISTDDPKDVIWNYHHRWPYASRELLPIANDSGGNLFCLDLSQEGKGRVVIQVHDEEGFPLIELAESFETFINSLVMDRDDF